MTTSLHRSLLLTSMVCLRGSPLDQFKHIVFVNGYVRAFNGLVHLQAPSGLDKDEKFSVSFDRLTVALHAVEGEEFEALSKPEFLVLKKGPLTVRVRKLDADKAYQAAVELPPKSERVSASGLQNALRQVAPFVSVDASRPWSVSALLRADYVWATNNLSLVRLPYPTPYDDELRIPGAAIPLLLELSTIDWIATQDNRVIIGCGEAVLSFPQANGQWPTLDNFFKAFPKRMEEADPVLHEAAHTIERFADRFVTLTDRSVETKVPTMESEYEIKVHKGKGVYNAKLFALVAQYATHTDFSAFPKPVFFRAGEMQGTMVGVADAT